MSSDEKQNLPGDETTGLPGLLSWRAVYLVVFGTFLLWIVLLAALTRCFS